MRALAFVMVATAGALLARVLLSFALVGGAAGYSLANSQLAGDVRRVVADAGSGLLKMTTGFVPGRRFETISVFDVAEVERRRNVRRELTSAGSLILTVGN